MYVFAFIMRLLNSEPNEFTGKKGGTVLAKGHRAVRESRLSKLSSNFHLTSPTYLIGRPLHYFLGASCQLWARRWGPRSQGGEPHRSYPQEGRDVLTSLNKYDPLGPPAQTPENIPIQQHQHQQLSIYGLQTHTIASKKLLLIYRAFYFYFLSLSLSRPAKQISGSCR